MKLNTQQDIYIIEVIKITDEGRIKILDLRKTVARKIYNMYRDNPNQKFDLKEFGQLIQDELKIGSNDFTVVMKYMSEREYIITHRDSVEASPYFIVRAQLIEFVETLPDDTRWVKSKRELT
ncbi:MAG: hypothetical protein ACFFDF_20625 [Candidatus Odinarchaeota archaeon]